MAAVLRLTRLDTLTFTHRERHGITRHYSVKLQTAKQTLSTSRDLTKFTYGDSPCHLKASGER